MRIDKTSVGGSISTIAMLAATTGRLYIAAFFMALGLGVLYPGGKNGKENIS